MLQEIWRNIVVMWSFSTGLGFQAFSLRTEPWNGCVDMPHVLVQLLVC